MHYVSVKEVRIKMTKRTIGIIAVIISAICFGLVPMFMKVVCAEGGNTLSGAFYRFALSLPPLYAYLKIKKIPVAVTRSQFGKICLITIAGYGGTSLLLFFSYNFIPSGMATTIHFVYPAMVILFSTVFLKEKVKPIKILCVALCMAGIILFHNGEAAVSLLGILLAFASGNTYAFYIIYLDKSELREMPSLKLIFYMNSVAAALILAVSLATGQFRIALTPTGWAAALLFAISVSFIAVLGFQIGVKYTGGQSAAILSTFEPITSVIIGVLVYEEKFSPKSIAGCILILLATVLVAKTKENDGEDRQGS